MKLQSLTGETPSVRPHAPRPGLPWRTALREAVRDPLELCQLLDLPREWGERARSAADQFPLVAPRGYVARMRQADPTDPLLRQVLPLDVETAPAPGFVADPVGDSAAELSPGLLQKYRGRALLITTGVCAVHCRYCFRRHFPYATAPRGPHAWDHALERIAADPTLHEAILSGGDPLSLVDPTLAGLAERLAEIPHLRRLRVHTRLPIVIPERVTNEMLAWLCGTRLTPIMVVHANHAQEIDNSVAAALGRMVDAGVPVLNQSVLLRGVNDSAAALAELCERLVDLRATPYYLHQLDRTAGAAHFEVPLERGRAIMAELRQRLPGYAVPRYVQEHPGAAHKTPLELAP